MGKEVQTDQQIADVLRHQPGKHPLARLHYISDPTGSGFEYGFDYIRENRVVAIDYWSYNRWGIFVQRHPKDDVPKIEIVKGETLTLLHLPEGFRIPVGPLHFENDSLPINEKELSADKAQAIAMAQTSGIKVNRDILEIADRFSRKARKYPDRYFFWQPTLPDSPTTIAIDFDAIEPYHMGLTLENAPTFTNTIVVGDEEG